MARVRTSSRTIRLPDRCAFMTCPFRHDRDAMLAAPVVLLGAEFPDRGRRGTVDKSGCWAGFGSKRRGM
jgi:hypothetical protein